MARFFGGMGGKGSGNNRFGTSGSTNANKGKISGSSSSLERAMASKEFMKGKKKGTQAEKSNEARYQELVAKKLENAKKQLMSDKKSNPFTPKGTKSSEKELSKSTLLAMELIAQKMAKKEMKKSQPDDPVVIKPTGLGGLYPGFIDAKGRVYDRYGSVVLKIDLQTGHIKTQGMFGKKIGKYDAKSTYCFYKIGKALEKFELNRLSKLNQASPAGAIYGHSSDDGGGGGLGW